MARAVASEVAAEEAIALGGMTNAVKKHSSGDASAPHRSRTRGAEAHFDDRLVASLASAEKQVQQSYRPIIGVHKWFARRPGSLFRGLILSELVNLPLGESYFEPHDLRGVVLDPFMGGGTSIFEANRVGLATIGYDTNPMARWIVEREIEPLDVVAFENAGEEIAAATEAELADLYLTTCEECGSEASVKFFLWVKTHTCECGHETLLFPGPLIAGRKMLRHTHDVLVCGGCRQVGQYLPGESPADCPCGIPYAATAVPGKFSCVCGREAAVSPKAAEKPPAHTLFALEYHCPHCKKLEGRRGRFFKGAGEEDQRRFALARERCEALGESPYWPTEPIEPGDETNRLLRWGYRRFRELHNERQLLGLAVLAERISQQPPALRSALATVYSDFIRYQNLACRYDPAALKVLDVFSIHGFPIHRIQCEAALIGIPGVGSGGFRHFVKKYAAAKRYCQKPYETRFDDGRKRRAEITGEQIVATVVDDEVELESKQAALLRCASIVEKPLPEQSVDLVITDPPYFSMVQYAELMDFCFVWLKRVAGDVPYFTSPSTRRAEEITGNATSGRSLDRFTQGLSNVFVGATKALKPGHLFAFTYHHNDFASYASLVVACLDAGLVPIRTAGCPSEMRGSIHINNTSSSRVDTVFLLRKPPTQVPTLAPRLIPELLAEQIGHLREAGLRVSEGDKRCLRFGLIAEAAIQTLAPAWDATAPVAKRMRFAIERLEAIASSLGGAGDAALAASARP